MVPDCRITIDTLFCGMDPLRLWKLSLERRVIKRPMQMSGLSDVRGEKFEHETRNRHRIAAVVDFCISCFLNQKVIFNFYHGKSFPTTLSEK